VTSGREGYGLKSESLCPLALAQEAETVDGLGEVPLWLPLDSRKTHSQEWLCYLPEMKKAAGGPPRMQLAIVRRLSVPHWSFLSRAKAGA
jgi:hypothetical protein